MSLFENLQGGLRALFDKTRTEREIDEELRAYLDEAVKDKMRRGMKREQAWREARVEMGSLEAVKDGIRSAGWEAMLETLWQDLRYAVRILVANRGFTVVAILTLALGIGANTAIFSLIDTVMLRSLPVARPDELVQIKIRDPRWAGEPQSTFTNPLWERVRERRDVLASAFAWGQQPFDLAQGGTVHFADGIFVSGDFFQSLVGQPAAGRLIAAGDDRRGCPAVAVLSYDFWQEHYAGAQSAIGSTLSLSMHPFEVIGVAPAGFRGVSVGGKFDVAAPLCAAAILDPKSGILDQRSWWWLQVMGRVRPGVSQAQLAARLGALSPQILAAALPQDWSAEMQKGFLKKSLVPVPAANGISFLRGRFERPLQILMAIVALVLLIACANIASLMLARGAARHREMAIRQALGASRTRLIRQLLTECVLLSCCGAMLGLAFARAGSLLLVRTISTAKEVVFLDIPLDTRTLGFTAAVAVLTGILFGVLPALRSTRISLTAEMKGGEVRKSQGHHRLAGRRWIVASQVALSLVLLVAAGLLLRTFAKLATLDIGFDRNNVLLVDTDLRTAKVPSASQAATYEEIERRLRALPGVVSAARSVITPISGGAWNSLIRTESPKAPTGDDALTWFNYVSPGYFDTLRMPLVAGRGFKSQDTSTGPKVAIVNQTLARKFFPDVNPLGRTFQINEVSGKYGAPIEVVGLIKDAKYETVREDTLPTAFFPVTQVPEHAEHQTFELRTAVPPSSLAGAVQAAVAGVNKELPLEFHSLAQQVNDSLVQERMLALLSGFFGVLALLLAMIGLYGTLSYVVTQRYSEFGIRMALGAPGNSILRLVMRDVVAVLGLGVIVGVGISLAATELLAKMLFGLGARDAVTIAGAVLVLAAVALVAGYLPARRATRVDPTVALRYE